ncbi:putative DNA-binding protein [Virgibacillus soli]|uniref:putative DNA-binding protein n=1 Tax=Paracerasibacillus soli TaxID=480284 RepID=UPI0035E6C1E5
MLDKTTRVNYLFDFYYVLLTKKQREYMEMYYLEDYSLGEISEIHHVSRQAVYDNIKRTENMLETYEKKLNLYKKFQERTEIIDALQEATAHKKHTEIERLIDRLKELD